MVFLRFLEKSKKQMVVSLDGVDLGFAGWIASKLSEDKTVSFVSSEYDHPFTANPVLRVSGDDVKKSLKKAVASAEKELKEFEKAF